MVQQFQLAVEAVNEKLVKEFETGGDPASVARRVGDVLVPAIHILQARTNEAPKGKDATILEEVKPRKDEIVSDLTTYIVKVRGRWVAMIDPPLPERKRDYWGTIFNAVVPDDNNGERERVTSISNCTVCFSCYEDPCKPALSKICRGSETGTEIQPCHADPHEGGETNCCSW